MSRDSVLALGRARVEASMRESVLAGTYELIAGDDLQPVETLTQTHYSGPASIEYTSLGVDEITPASQSAATADLVLKVPVAAPFIPKMTVVTVSASLADASLVGRRFRVKGSPQSGQVTSHRYPLEELP